MHSAVLRICIEQTEAAHPTSHALAPASADRLSSPDLSAAKAKGKPGAASSLALTTAPISEELKLPAVTLPSELLAYAREQIQLTITPNDAAHSRSLPATTSRSYGSATLVELYRSMTESLGGLYRYAYAQA